MFKITILDFTWKLIIIKRSLTNFESKCIADFKMLIVLNDKFKYCE